MNKIEIYTSAFCIYCFSAKRLLKKIGLEYEEIKVGGDSELRKSLIEKYAWSTLPIITINGSLIGGYTDLLGLVKSGEIDEYLENDAP